MHVLLPASTYSPALHVRTVVVVAVDVLVDVLVLALELVDVAVVVVAAVVVGAFVGAFVVVHCCCCTHLVPPLAVRYRPCGHAHRARQFPAHMPPPGLPQIFCWQSLGPQSHHLRSPWPAHLSPPACGQDSQTQNQPNKEAARCG